MSVETEQLIRLSQVLAERGTPLEGTFAAITAAGTASVYLGIAALSPRLDVMLPMNRVYLDTAVPGLELPDPVPARGVIRLSRDRARLDAAVVAIGEVTAQQAVDELVPPAVRDAWRSVIEPLLAAGGKVMHRARFLTDERARISVSFGVRAGDAETRFASAMSEHLWRIGASETQRRQWQDVYAMTGAGRVLSIISECTPGGMTPYLAILDDHTSFDHAIDLAKLLEPNRATLAAIELGTISGSLGIERLMGVETVLGTDSPELFVWLPPRTA